MSYLPAPAGYFSLYVCMFVCICLIQGYTFFYSREGERERNIDVREKHQLVASHTHPNWGPNLQARYVPSLGIEPTTFLVYGMMLQPTVFKPLKKQEVVILRTIIFTAIIMTVEKATNYFRINNNKE